MSRKFPKLGKLPKNVFDKIIYPNTGLMRSEVIVPPKHGVDVGVVELGDKALILKTDPVFVVPEYGWERSAWFAFHILASDVSTSGNKPMYLAINLNLPQKMLEDEFKKLWLGIHSEAKKYGVSIVSGHTGVYGGVNYPMIGGATMISVTEKNHYVTTEMARPGDLIIMTKGPAIETTGILSVMFPEIIEKHGGNKLRRTGETIFYRQSVVNEALELSKLGLRTVVSSMHDATEYGVWGAIQDISLASKTKIRIYKERLFINKDVKAVLNALMEGTGFTFDPYTAISEGTLLATVARDYGEEAIDKLKKIGVEADIIGMIIGHGEGVFLNDEGIDKQIDVPSEDPFWTLFFKLHSMRMNEG